MPEPDPTERAALRRHMRALLAEVDAADLERRSRRAAEALIGAGYLDRVRAVLLFAPLRRADGSCEIETLPIAREAWRRGITVTLPRVDWAARRLTPAVVENYEADLVTGRHSVMEPRPDLPDFPAAELDLIVVPGLAFDRAGHRLGHGVGFYDRFLAALGTSASGPRRPVFVGLALAEQMVNSLPIAPHDVPMHVVVTDAEVFLPSSRGR